MTNKATKMLKIIVASTALTLVAVPTLAQDLYGDPRSFVECSLRGFAEEEGMKYEAVLAYGKASGDYDDMLSGALQLLKKNAPIEKKLQLQELIGQPDYFLKCLETELRSGQ